MNLKFKKNNKPANPGKPPKICHNTYAWCISYTVRILIPFFCKTTKNNCSTVAGSTPFQWPLVGVSDRCNIRIFMT